MPLPRIVSLQLLAMDGYDSQIFVIIIIVIIIVIQ